jgi:hypothetical protein
MNIKQTAKDPLFPAELSNLSSPSRVLSIDEELDEPTGTLGRDRIHTELLRITVEEAFRHQPVRRRSELARRDYKPAHVPISVTEYRRPWWRPLVDLGKRLILPLSLAVFIALMWAGGRWIDQHSRGWVYNEGATGRTVPALHHFDYYYFNPTLGSVHQLVVPGVGWMLIIYKGTVADLDHLPANPAPGDTYFCAKNNGTYWVRTVLRGQTAPSWVDP